MLSDFCFHKQHFPQYHELKKKWLVLITAQDLVCDYAECSENLITDTVRLNCFHTFHKTCLDKTGNKCPICVPCLSKKISSLCEAFNESIIKPTSRSLHQKQPTQAVSGIMKSMITFRSMQILILLIMSHPSGRLT